MLARFGFNYRSLFFVNFLNEHGGEPYGRGRKGENRVKYTKGV